MIKKQSIKPHSVFQYLMSSGGRITPSILDALIDKPRRARLECITEALTKRNLLDQLYYGISGLTFKDVADLLDATT